MESKRLTYAALGADDIDAFHGLVQDAHVRRYLLDDKVFPRDWSVDRIGDSQRLFDQRGVGLWLARDTSTGALVGFCGFLDTGAEHPELVYALSEQFTGKGYATEMARASIAEARRHPDFATILAAVDEVNAASVRVLDKLGFRCAGTRPGSLGAMLLYRLG